MKNKQYFLFKKVFLNNIYNFCTFVNDVRPKIIKKYNLYVRIKGELILL